MENDLTLIVFGVTGFTALLLIILTRLAIGHDRALSAMGHIEELSYYEAKVEQKKQDMVELEDDLQKRREAFANIAEMGAEVDALQTRKENLNIEWASLEERRQEVQDVRQDMEAAMTERQALESELVSMRSEHDHIKERLEKAEHLAEKVAVLTAQEADLRLKLESARDQMAELEAAEKRLLDLNQRSQDLETEISRKHGTLDAQDAALSDISERLIKQREALSEDQIKAASLQSEIAAGNMESARLTGDLESLSDRRSQMNARLAQLEREIASAQNAAAGSSSAHTDDPLRELQEAPKVIKQLAQLGEPSPITEDEALHNVERRMRAFGLEYPQRTVRAFHTAMKVNESSQMAVLAGISGTGKSQLPRQYAAAMGIGFLQVPVQPRWDSPQDLMGFYNYIEGRFRPTDLARSLWALDTLNNEKSALDDRMMMVLLDEMNLARVEYYFSDFLSRLESRPGKDRVSDIGLRKDAEIELEIPKLDNPPRIFPGYNLLFAGTMNEDESTQSLSDKVVDRANILRFSAPRSIVNGAKQEKAPDVNALSLKSWNSWARPISTIESNGEVSRGLEKMVELMRDFKRPFGHRLGRAIMAYIANYPQLHGGDPIRSALADQIEMRLLPKLRGVEVDALDNQFNDLRKFVEETLRDEALSQAIEDSRQQAHDATGQFVWSGVSR